MRILCVLHLIIGIIVSLDSTTTDLIKIINDTLKMINNNLYEKKV